MVTPADRREGTGRADHTGAAGQGGIGVGAEGVCALRPKGSLLPGRPVRPGASGLSSPRLLGDAHARRTSPRPGTGRMEGSQVRTPRSMALRGVTRHGLPQRNDHGGGHGALMCFLDTPPLGGGATVKPQFTNEETRVQ